MNLFKIIGILLCIAAPLPAFAQKAKTIDELAAMLDSSMRNGRSHSTRAP
jgi:hypothetical protein